MAGYILAAAAVVIFVLWLLQPTRRRREQNTASDRQQDRQYASRVDVISSPPPQHEPLSDASTLATLPERDNWDAGILINEDKQLAVELPAWIHYRDAAGQESRRDIIVKRLFEQQEGGEAILAFCEARKANRTFVVGRILQFVDRRTGEVITRVPGYLRQTYVESPRGRVQRAIGVNATDVHVLIFIARADGALRQRQRDIIADHLRRTDPSLVGCDAELTSAIASLRPQQAEYRKHIRAITNRPEGEKASLLATVEAIAATRTTTREFTEGALQIARKALGPPMTPKPRKASLKSRDQPKVED